MEQRHNSLVEDPNAKALICFALPVFWGDVYQQRNNAADSLIVGQLLGDKAQADVSTAG